jgi:hypothetical protein
MRVERPAIRVRSKLTAVTTRESSETWVPKMSPAVEQPQRCAPGYAAKVSRRAGPFRASGPPKTKTR